MDKILRRVRMAERQVVRRRKKLATTEFINETKRVFRKATVEMHGEVKASLLRAKRARREDWELGPIAPRRDVPRVALGGASEEDVPVQWGTVGTRLALANLELMPADREKRCAWAGGSEYLCLAPGDRVVVTEGHLKGKLDRISAISIEHGTVTLEEARVNTTLPPWFKGMGDVGAIPLRLPISAVRLVHPIPDEETGVTRDVIIRQLKPIRVMPDRPTRTVTWTRVVPGLNLTIPWPRAERPKEEDNACDTLRIDVEERTFIPTLLAPPMPGSVIDELRNQYSKFRTRHTDEYIARKAAEEAEARARREQAREMLTPVQEFNRKQRELRRARGQPVLTEEMLAKIGEVMAKNLNGQQKRDVGSIPAETAAAREEGQAPVS